MANVSNRTYQSSTFSLLFSIPEYALELYNSINGSSYDDPALIAIRELDQGVELSVRNDVSFIIGSVLNLYEHQSTHNPNMPYRLLQYVSRMYEKLMKDRDIYGARLLMLPEPRFAVFYTGKDARPAVEEMKLSDAYETETDGEVQLELKCLVYNLNAEEVKERFSGTASLKGYMTFVDKVKELKENGSVSEDVINAAIDYCISHGILVSFFRENRKEIIHTMIIDETYENRLRLAKAEAERDRIELGQDYENRLRLVKAEAERDRIELKAEAERDRIELRNEIDAKLIAGIRNLMQTMQIDQEQAMDLLLISGEDRKRLAAVIAEQKKEPDSDE